MNDTQVSDDKLAMELRSRPDAQIWMESFVYIVINSVALFGNILVCWIFYRNPRLRTVTNIYIMALALSDVVISSLCMPLVAVVLITGLWPFPIFICKAHGFFVLFLAFVSLHTIALTAINRYYRVVKADAFKRIFTKKFAVFSVLVVMGLAAFLLALPLVARWAFFDFHSGKMTCSMEFYKRSTDVGYSSFLLLIIVFSPFFTIIYCYRKVFKAVQIHRQRLSSTTSTGSNETSNSLSVEEVNITKTLFSIVLGFSICWIPVFIIEFVDSLFGSHGLPRSVYLVYSTLVSISAAINPIIYGIMNKTFRGEYIKIFHSCRRRTEVEDINIRRLGEGMDLALP